MYRHPNCYTHLGRIYRVFAGFYWQLLLTVFLCKYTKVLWLCKSKGFHNSFLRVCINTLRNKSLNRYGQISSNGFGWQLRSEWIFIDRVALVKQEHSQKQSAHWAVDVTAQVVLCWFIGKNLSSAKRIEYQQKVDRDDDILWGELFLLRVYIIAEGNDVVLDIVACQGRKVSRNPTLLS